MTGRAAIAIAALMMLGCTRHDIRQAVDTREENVDHQRLDPQPPAGIGSGAVETYTLQPGESYRMPQLHTAPPPVLGDREQRQELALTTVCVQLVIDADGKVDRSIPIADRTACQAGAAAENGALRQAVQEAVQHWRFSPAAVCHFAPGKHPRDPSDCEGADRIEPIPVSLLYAFTFEIVKGRHYVRRKGDGGD